MIGYIKNKHKFDKIFFTFLEGDGSQEPEAGPF